MHPQEPISPMNLCLKIIFYCSQQKRSQCILVCVMLMVVSLVCKCAQYSLASENAQVSLGCFVVDDTFWQRVLLLQFLSFSQAGHYLPYCFQWPQTCQHSPLEFIIRSEDIQKKALHTDVLYTLEKFICFLHVVEKWNKAIRYC